MIPITISMKKALMHFAVGACFQLVNIIDTQKPSPEKIQSADEVFLKQIK